MGVIKITKWVLKTESGKEYIENQMNEINKRFVFVERKYIDQIKSLNIPTFSFSDEAKQCCFVRRGKKQKRFSEEDIGNILDDLESMSIRNVAFKYKCSTRTIQDIKNNKY